MNDIIGGKESGIVGLLHGGKGTITVPKPFEKDIFLLDTHIAGTSFVEGIEELEPYLNINDRLELFREAENPYDNMAIVIRNKDGAKLGYVPRSDNPILSRLMDAGKMLFARISDKETIGNWLRIKIKIFLHE